MCKSQFSEGKERTDNPLIKALERITELETEVEKLTGDLLIF